MAARKPGASLGIILLSLLLSTLVLSAVFLVGRLTNTARAATGDLGTSAKRVSSASAIPGQVLTYTIVLTNTGAGSASARLNRYPAYQRDLCAR